MRLKSLLLAKEGHCNTASLGLHCFNSKAGDLPYIPELRQDKIWEKLT